MSSVFGTMLAGMLVAAGATNAGTVTNAASTTNDVLTDAVLTNVAPPPTLSGKILDVGMNMTDYAHRYYVGAAGLCIGLGITDMGLNRDSVAITAVGALVKYGGGVVFFLSSPRFYMAGDDLVTIAKSGWTSQEDAEQMREAGDLIALFASLRYALFIYPFIHEFLPEEEREVLGLVIGFLSAATPFALWRAGTDLRRVSWESEPILGVKIREVGRLLRIASCEYMVSTAMIVGSGILYYLILSDEDLERSRMPALLGACAAIFIDFVATERVLRAGKLLKGQHYEYDDYVTPPPAPPPAPPLPAGDSSPGSSSAGSLFVVRIPLARF